MSTQNNKKAPKIDYIIDATNVCNWHVANKGVRSNASRSNEPNDNVSLDTLLKLVNILLEKKQTFQCIFDANTSYNIPEEELKIYNLLLDDYQETFYQVTGGIRADSFVLSVASSYHSFVISNDNYNDYQSTYPWIKRDAKPQRLFKGGIPMVAGVKHLILPDLGINVAIEEPTDSLFSQLRAKLGSKHPIEGQVLSFDPQKGVGYIMTEDSNEIYFNRSHIKVEEETPVTFYLNSTHDGKTFANDIVFKGIAPPLKIWSGETLFGGYIDWFNEEKGFGAIKEEETNETIFFFRSGFDENEIRVRQGLEVVFEKKENKKGPYADSIKLGKPKDFTLKKDIFSEDQKIMDKLQGDLQKSDKKLQTIEKHIDALYLLANVNKHLVHKGVVEKCRDFKGIIRIENTDLEVSFTKSSLGKGKRTIKPKERILLQIQPSKQGLKAFNIQADGAIKAPLSPNPPTRKVAIKNTKKTQEEAPSKPVSPQTNEKPQPKGAKEKELTLKTDKTVKPKETKNVRPNPNNNNGKQPFKRFIPNLPDPLADSKKSVRNGKEPRKEAKQVVKEKVSPTEKTVKKATPKANAPSKTLPPKTKTAPIPQPTNAKNTKTKNTPPATTQVVVEKKEIKTKSGGKKGKSSFGNKLKEIEANKPKIKFKPENERGGNDQKLVFWAKDSKEEDVLLIYRLKAKEGKIEAWAIKEKEIKPAFLAKILKEDQKIDTRTFPRERSQSSFDFNTKKIIPKNWKTNQKTFIKRILDGWTEQMNQIKLYSKVKEEVATIYKKVKALKVYNAQLWDAAISAGDKVIQYGQQEKISKEQSVDLRKDINQCYERLRKLPKRKS